MTITFNAVNDAPVATTDEYTASEDATLKEMPRAVPQDGAAETIQRESPDTDGAGSRDLDAGQEMRSVTEPSGCTTAQRSNPGDWMACIAELERAGLTTMAADELAELRQSFPQFLVQ